MPAYVYMLRCSDGSYYIGSTRADWLDKRLGERQSGVFPGYTSSRRPVTLVWSQQFDRIIDAVLTERRLKGWSRAKKEALIRHDWEAVQALARRRAGKSRNPRPSRLASLAPQDED
jgi:putative endonuclease